MSAALTVEDVTVRFGGNVALHNVSLTAEAGAITGLIGPNGAGKTTLFNVVTGLQTPTTGRVRLGDRDVTRVAPHKRARAGLSRTFQRLELFTLLSVHSNIRVAADLYRSYTRDRSIDPDQVAEEVLDRLGIGALAASRVDQLPTGLARLVEVGRALATRPRVLLLDEPASGQDEAETAALAQLLRGLAADGMAVVLVEHDVDLVMQTCDRIHVLDFGEMLAVGSADEIQVDPAVVAAYLGGRAMTTTMLELRGLRAAYERIEVVRGVSLEVAEGEVVALLGPNGAGKSTTLKVIAGLLAPSGGDVLLAGRRVNGARPDDLARAGLCLIPEGRGVFPNLTVRENLQVATHAGPRMADVEAAAFDRFPRLAERRHQVAGTLSGGEQQMLALARGIASQPAMLLLDELSMGLAPLVVESLYEKVREIAREGVSILIVEQFASVVLDVADRAAIMVQGTIRAIGPPEVLAAELQSAYLGGRSN